MKLIPLTQGKFAMVDDADFDRCLTIKWHASKRKNGIYYACQKNRKGVTYIHRFILSTPLGMNVDHIDRNPLNNQRSNLRLCSDTQNQVNRAKQSNNTTGFKGVFKSHKVRKPWKAQTAIKGKTIHLGHYETKEEAAKAYDQYMQAMHGEFSLSSLLK